MTLPRFAQLDQRLTAAVSQRLANATVQLLPGGPAWAAMYDHQLPEVTPFTDVATVAAHTLTMHFNPAMPVPAEGGEVVVNAAQWPAGQVCRITTPPEPDQSGWATFDVVPVS